MTIFEIMRVKNDWEKRFLNPRGWYLSKCCYPDEYGLGRRFLYFNGVSTGVSFYDGATLFKDVIDYIRHGSRKNPIVIVERVRRREIEPIDVTNVEAQKMLVKKGIVDIHDAVYMYPKIKNYVVRKIARDRKKERAQDTAVDDNKTTWTHTENGWVSEHGEVLTKVDKPRQFKSHWKAVEAFLQGQATLEEIYQYNETALFIVAGLYRQFTLEKFIVPTTELRMKELNEKVQFLEESIPILHDLKVSIYSKLYVSGTEYLDMSPKEQKAFEDRYWHKICDEVMNSIPEAQSRFKCPCWNYIENVNGVVFEDQPVGYKYQCYTAEDLKNPDVIFGKEFAFLGQIIGRKVLNLIDMAEKAAAASATVTKLYATDATATIKPVVDKILHNPDNLTQCLLADKNSPIIQHIVSQIGYDPFKQAYPFLNKPGEADTKPLRHWSDVRNRFLEVVQQNPPKLIDFKWHNGIDYWSPVYSPSSKLINGYSEYVKLLMAVLSGQMSGRTAQLLWTNGHPGKIDREKKRFADKHLEFHPFYSKKHTYLDAAKLTLPEAIYYIQSNINQLRTLGFRKFSDNVTAFNFGDMRFRLNCDTGEIRFVRYAHTVDPHKVFDIIYKKAHYRNVDTETQELLKYALPKVRRAYTCLQRFRPLEEKRKHRMSDWKRAIQKWLCPTKEKLDEIKAKAHAMILDYEIGRAKYGGNHMWIEYFTETGSRFVQVC